jgi:tetratricopeptide (TPR) repeat protein
MMSQNNPAAAVPYFHLAALADPQSAIAAGELGTALFASADSQEAEQQFKRALELDPKYTDARYNLASVEATNAQWPEAVSDFKLVLNSNPNHKNASQHLGEALFMWAEDLSKAGQREQAVQKYKDSLVFRPDDAELHARLGTALASLSRVDEARAELQAALRIDPYSTEAKQALALLK